VLTGLMGPAIAQSYPTKPVRIVVPFPSGQGADVLMRVLAERLSATMGERFYVDNRPGAGGTIGMEHAAKSAPDGYTLVMGGSGPTSISPSLYATLPYDPLKDFDPVTGVASVPQLFLVHPSSPFKDLRDFIAAAKAKPGEIAYGSSGSGTTQHLFVELFASMAGIKLSHVPYKGSAPALNDLMGGHIPFVSDTLSAALPLVKGGKVRALGVTSLQRSPFLPDIPTLDEQGVKGYDAVGWITLLAPAGTPKEILDRLDQEIAKVLQEPDTAKRLEDLALTPMLLHREQLREFIAAEIVKWRKVVQESGAKVE
jgi:tripartite-type tricarboxylate transporter receptor subunit TctC